MTKRLQNRIAESRFTFPVTIIYGIAVWIMAGALERGLYAQLAMFVAGTLMMVALNNSNALIRIYSRMVSCSFVMITCASTFLFSSIESSAVSICFILFYLSIMRSYQDKRSPGIVFYSFACIGIASLFFVQILYFVPFLWILMATNLMAMTHKMFLASIIGIAMPYWFGACYYIYTDQTDLLIAHFAELIRFEPLLQYDSLDIHRLATLGMLAILTLIGIIHYMRNSYLDKIRTRMIYEFFITIDILAIVFLALQPSHIDQLLPVITINTSCLYAHYSALTRTRITNATFIIVGLAMVALTIFNLAL